MTCVGKDTYLSASYWLTLLATYNSLLILGLGLGSGLANPNPNPNPNQTCVGKETYLSASYWLTLETMFEMEEKENLPSVRRQ